MLLHILKGRREKGEVLNHIFLIEVFSQFGILITLAHIISTRASYTLKPEVDVVKGCAPPIERYYISHGNGWSYINPFRKTEANNWKDYCNLI